MRNIFLPNAINFHALKTGTNRLSSIFGINKQDHTPMIEKDPIISRANRYLKRQDKRLIKYAQNQDQIRFEYLAKILLKKSLSFQVGSFNFKSPNWFWAWDKKNVKGIFNDTVQLAKKEAYDIFYSRTWIPKGDDPVGRPLGAPSVPWRPYLYQMLYFEDTWAEHNQLKKSWQHGGYAKRGVNTFIDDMIEREILNHKYIWEFDLKGYFNNVTHESMIKALKESPNFLKEHFKKALPSKPKTYHPIPKENDPALTRYEQGMGYLNANIQGPFEKTKFQGYDTFIGSHHALILRPDLSGAIITRGTLGALENIPKDIFDDHFWIGYDKLPSYNIKKVYKLLMESGTSTYGLTGFNASFVQDLPTGNEQMEGRDEWAGLCKEGAGTPQGASWSPFLTSLASGYATTIDQIIMYMDDGLIYANSKKELESNINAFRQSMTRIGVELQEKKCGYLKENGIWNKDLKILGTSYYHTIDWMFSKTRSGTSRPFPRPDYEEIIKYEKENLIGVNEFQAMLTDLNDQLRTAVIEGSKSKLIKWIIRQITRLKHEGSFKPVASHIYGERHGLTGQFLAKSWEKEGEKSAKALIHEGIQEKVFKIDNAKRTSFLRRKYPNKVIDPSNLSQISTIMTKSLLIWLGNTKRTASKKSKAMVGKTV